MSEPLTAAHWGTYRVVRSAGQPMALEGFPDDPSPSSIGEAIVDTLSGPMRIDKPMVRRGFLENRTDHRRLRGRDSFVAMEWDEALDLAAGELNRIRDQFGNQAIYAGSYGWASAGRFHHAQSQLRRFMNLFGGYTSARNTYSHAAAEVILPYVAGSLNSLFVEHTSWRSIAAAGGLVVAFGGFASRNAQVNSGGVGQHSQPQDIEAARRAGVSFVNISPDRSDIPENLKADWLPVRPNTDVALMLALAHVLVSEGLYDREFVEGYCIGFEKFLPYLTGQSDGQAKDAAWAAEITGLPAADIIALARRMSATPTLVNASWSLTRQQNGEQAYWMLIVLAALLGGIGKPGQGFGLGLGAVNGLGSHRGKAPWAAFPTGRNPVDSHIPVARIADMLLHPGQPYKYDGQERSYPDIQLVYWVGGNPFHHHQDLNRLRRAWQNIGTVIVHEPHWTPVARHADIIFPATVAMERNDLGASSRDDYLTAMSKSAEPYGQARNDHDIFAGLARRLSRSPDAPVNFEAAFTNGWTEDQWLRDMYQRTRTASAKSGIDLPDYETFSEAGFFRVPPPEQPRVMLQAFRENPDACPLETPTGRIEIFSETIAGFGLEGIPGHPVWREPAEWLGSVQAKPASLHLITHQPTRRLHSQLDHSAYSRAGKMKMREPCRLNPEDAAARGISEGDLVRLHNERGATISVAIPDPGVRQGVVMLATGAWYDPDLEGDETCCKHGNPNTLTRDQGTSELAQGPGAMTCLVDIERLSGPAPEVTAFVPPVILRGDKGQP